MNIITIGRSSECNVVINDSYVGRTHLQIIISNDGSYYCVDLNSKNGTYVNGRRITGKVLLKNNDIIRIGNTTLPWQQYIGSISKGKNRNNIWIPIIVGIVILLIFGGICIYIGNDSTVSGSSNEPSVGNFLYDDNNGSANNNESVEKDETTQHLYTSNAKPTINSMQYDLIGHKLSEGVSDGYHEEDWTYEIKDNSISLILKIFYPMTTIII